MEIPKLTGFMLPNYQPENGEPVGIDGVQEASDQTPKSYIIPPVLWMVAFLIVGYIGLSYLVEGE